MTRLPLARLCRLVLVLGAVLSPLTASAQDTAAPKTLSDLTWTDFVPDRGSTGLLSLITLVAILGWMIMRQKDEEEIDAIDMVEKYGTFLRASGARRAVEDSRRGGDLQ